MKRLLVAIFVIVFIPSVYINAQKIGVRGGVDFNTSDIKYPGASVDKKVGFQAGIATEKSISSILGLDLTADLMYSQQRFAIKYSMAENVGQTFNFEQNKLDLPINVRKTFRLPSVKPFVQAGPYVSYILSGKIKSGDYNPSLDFDGADRFDAGFNVGLGCKLPYGLQVMAAYTHGLIKQDTRINGDDKLFPVKNRKVSISAAYLFGF